MLEVVEPGLLSTIQDSGRPLAAELGVSRSGACDPLALRVLQRLLSNGDEPVDPTIAVLEVTLLGPTLIAREDCLVGLTGADFCAEITSADGTTRPMDPGATTVIGAGDTLRFGDPRGGCRAYLGLAGGIDVPLVLGSRSTCLAGAFGGVDGRPLRAGDLLRPVNAGVPVGRAERRWPGTSAGAVSKEDATILRVVRGPHAKLFPGDVLERLVGADWSVSVRSDRMGIRLEGPPLGLEGERVGEFVSQPMIWGAVQLPPSGQPIVLLADHQTVGGYPVPLVVISVDLPSLGQLTALDHLRFELIELDQARMLLLGAEEVFAAAGATH